MPMLNRNMNKPSSTGLQNINWRRLINICRKKISSFERYGEKYITPNGPYYYKNNGSNILAVAHLDTVLGALHSPVLKLSYDTFLFCPTLDDRAGVYAIVDYLPSVMKNDAYDILLTTGEENMRSSANYFRPPKGKKYNWMFSFDRRGDDAVIYKYRDPSFIKELGMAGWELGQGTYSDISDLEHLGCCGVNFGVGYTAEHTKQCSMSRNQFLAGMRRFLTFWDRNAFKAFSHLPKYNVYIPGRGFDYIYETTRVKSFSETDITIIQIMEDYNYDFQGGTVIIPEDLDELIKDFQKEDHIDKGKNYTIKRQNQLDLNFENVEEAKIKKAIKGSEDNPVYKSQPRKAEGDKDINPEHKKSVTVTHEIKVEKEDNGLHAPMYDQCTECHEFYEVKGTGYTLCPNCKGGLYKGKANKSRSKTFKQVKAEPSMGLKVAAKVPLYKRTERDEEYAYIVKKDEWLPVTKTRTNQGKIKKRVEEVII